MPISTSDLPARLAAALHSRERFILPAAERRQLREGAVLALLVPQTDDFALVFTRRTDQVATHKGQIAFPGGGSEPSDRTLWDTALRETYEELGIPPALIEYVGALDDLATTSRFALTPFVGLMRARPRYVPQETEVAEVFEAPLQHLLHPANQTVYRYERDGLFVVSPAFRFGNHLIWGVTARILEGLVGILRALRNE
ncbi:MAG: CoA pyrophosphatase [Chloroflexota bacterium]|nr:CoA pyrophosphatase [Dehalococcoidia bacterium]MDW8255195.1 CoA pyrophosphatase [Chloroflexota bacterium]